MENNKLIAEFMGYIDNGCSEDGFLKHPETNWDIEIDSFKYHNSWDWIMPVVEKIESIENGIFDVEILKHGTKVIHYTEMEHVIINNVNNISFENKIEHIYNAVIEFIHWYNEQK